MLGAHVGGLGMFFTTDTTTALAEARNDTLDLANKKAGVDEDAENDKVSGLLESLAAVIPTGITAFYTVFASIARTEMLERGADERTAVQAAEQQLVPPPSAADLAAKLEAMPLESKDLIELRWGVLAVAVVAALSMAVQAVLKANRRSKKKRSGWRLSLEPMTAAVALVGWGLAAPGTPLGAYMSSDDLGVTLAAIAAIAGLVLLGFGTKLAEPAKSG
jgi:hypothetical protein